MDSKNKISFSTTAVGVKVINDLITVTLEDGRLISVPRLLEVDED